MSELESTKIASGRRSRGSGTERVKGGECSVSVKPPCLDLLSTCKISHQLEVGHNPSSPVPYPGPGSKSSIAALMQKMLRA